MSLTPEDIGRRIGARRTNERLKLLATTLNTIGLTLFGTSIVAPMVAGGLNVYASVWIMVAAGLHFGAHATPGKLRGED